MAAAAGGAGMGMNAMGATMGGIGDLISALGYQRPKLQQPGGQEQRLRSLAQGQAIGGGLESIQGTALYNQLLPAMMSLVPGMTVTPAGAPGGGGAAGPSAQANAANAPMASYQQALANYQAGIGRNQTIQNLKDQLKTMGAGPNKKATRQQLKSLRKQNRGQPTVPQLERQIYQAATVAPQMNVTMDSTNAPAATGPGTVAGQQLSPTNQSTLAQIQAWLQGSQDAAANTSNVPPLQSAAGSFISDYNNALNTSPLRSAAGGNYLSDYTNTLNAYPSAPTVPYAPSQPTSAG